MLTEAKIRRLAARSKAYRVADVPTLSIVVQVAGTKNFVQRLTVRGQQVDIGLGGWPVISLEAARRTALDNRTVAKAGGDPRRVKLDPPTFAEAQEKVIANQRGNWRAGGKTEFIWRREMDRHAGTLLPMRVDQVTVADLEAVLSPIWTEQRETARRLKQRISLVLKWSYAHGFREGNPADVMDMILPRQRRQRTHFKALPFADVPAALITVENSDAWLHTKLAFRFMVLCAGRSGEVRNMTWSEITADNMWIIPGSKMKAGREHKVPLSRQALEVLEVARKFHDGNDSGLVFPSQRGKVASDSTLSKLLRENGVASVPHGFRSSFRGWCAEATNFPRAVAELALAHVNDNETEAAYLRADMLTKRAALLQAWADFITAERSRVVRIAG